MEILTPGLTFLLTMLLFTAFAKIFTALSILSVGIGIRGVGFGTIVAALSLVLSCVVMKPYLGEELFFGSAKVSSEQVSLLQEKLKPFMELHSDRGLQQSFADVQGRLQKEQSAEKPNGASSDISVLGAAFFVTQLREAFFLGLIFLIPFLVVDLIVTNGMMLLGVSQLPVAMIALPLKLLIFILIDGWGLVSQRLLTTFVGG
jgi:flagellar biosynthesis protein FliP